MHRPTDPGTRATGFARALGSRGLRLSVDLAWVCSFVVVLVLVLRESSSGTDGAAQVRLELEEGTQQQGLYRRGKRVATVRTTVRRWGPGWRVEHRFEEGALLAGRTVLGLRRDLSLAELELSADPGAIARLSGLSSALLDPLKGFGRVEVRGECSLETGECRLSGKLGPRRIDQRVSAGRGPVVTSAIYPLLARGSLGREVELSIFDPLELRQRVVAFRVEGAEKLALSNGQRLDALRVLRDLEGLATRVWIDSRGRVLKEELPFGYVVEHEAFTARDPG